MKLITDMAQVPAFETEAQEAAFWAGHELAPHLLSPDHADADLLPPTRERAPKSNPTSIRLGRDLEGRLRRLAELKGTSYQTLLKEFVQERTYEEEKRLKII